MVAGFIWHARGEVVKQLGDRLADRSIRLIKENGYQKHERFARLEVVWPCVVTVADIVQIGDNPRLQAVCDALNNFLTFSLSREGWPPLKQHSGASPVAANKLHHAERFDTLTCL